MKTKDEIKVSDEDVVVVKGGGNVACKGMVIDTIVTATAIVSAAGGLKFFLEMVKLWIEARKERRIRLKKGDVELELQGNMGGKEIEEKIKLFERLTRENQRDEIQIIIP